LLEQTRAGHATAGLPADLGDADARCIAGQLAIARHQPELALGDIDRGLAILRALRVPDAASEIDCRAQRANALIALQRGRDARAEAESAFTRQMEANPAAKLKLARLLAVRVRAEQADSDAEAAAQSIAHARALGAPAELLADQDRVTLGL
jgi:hypothetical protein